MKGSCIPSIRLCHLLMTILLTLALQGRGQGSLHTYLEYAVSTSCINTIDNKKASFNRYFIQLDILAVDQDVSAPTLSNFEIIVNGGQTTQFHVDSTEIPHTLVLGPFVSTGQGQDIINVTLRSLDNDLIDYLELTQVICGLTTNNGLNQPGFICRDDDQAVFAQAAPVIARGNNIVDDLNIYIITNISGQILGYNSTGLFDDLEGGIGYQIHYYTVASHESSNFLSGVIIGDSYENLQESACYKSCGTYDVTITCENFDLALQKDVIDGPVFSIGDTVEYTITVINEGLATGYNVVVRDMIPEGMRFVANINPFWGADAISLPIDSIQPGATHTIPIKLILEPTVTTMEIDNIAEIFFAADQRDDDSPAFDDDSTPDNEDAKEDDIDDESILVLERLCAETFSMTLETNKPFCKSEAISLIAHVESAHMPVVYTWRLDGNIVSTDSRIDIENPTAADYGQYQVIASDGMGCDIQLDILVQEVVEQNINCISSINLTVASDCSLGLIPDMLVLNPVSGINDYILEITDVNGDLVDVDNVSGNDLSAPLTVKLVHPCTFQTVCWANVNAAYKLDPVFDFYRDTTHLSCLDIQNLDQNSSSYELLSSIVLDERSFDSLLQQNICLQEWETYSSDIILKEFDCGDGLIARIYSIQFNGRTVPLDTALIKVSPIEIDSIVWPADISNVSCLDEITLDALDSYPILVINEDTMILDIIDLDKDQTSACNLSISYGDQESGGFCAFGTKKILREWTVVDWCSDEVDIHTQHIYIVDKESPEILMHRDSIVLALNGPICSGDIDLSGVVDVRDNCDPNPAIFIGDYDSDGLFIQGIDAGYHKMQIIAIDACGNEAIDTIHIRVTETTPPTPVILSNISMTYTESSSTWIYGDMFDSNSSDGCGPVTIEIARASEIQQIRSNGDLAVWELRDRCEEGLESEDANKDGEITVAEIFRERILFCCSDVGQTIKIAVRVKDQFDNYTDIDAWIKVVSKDEPLACDDGDPCTIGDRILDGCPCRGDVDVSDLDQDGIPDCIDQDFIVCMDNVTTSIERNELELYLDMGATPGQCEELALADIGGEVRTYYGDMIENVTLSNNNIAKTSTDQDGLYAFKANEMYISYELRANKNDDPLNGISALDIVLIQQYLLGLGDFKDDAALLAADINDDGRITAVDIVQLRQLLLGQTMSFPQNDSWIFMPADPGLNPDNPFDYERHIMIESLEEHQMKEDWIGIKIGDVSGNASSNSNKANVRTIRQKMINIPQMDIQKGEEVIVPFYMDNGQRAKAIQFSIADRNEYTVKGLIPGALSMTQEHYHILDEGGGVNMVWTDERSSMLAQEVLFSLIIEPVKSTTTADAFDINTGDLVDRLYDQHDEEYELILKAVDQHNKYELGDVMYQNEPNPFIDQTTIPIELSSQKAVMIRFYNSSGALLLERAKNYPAGRHDISISREELNTQSGPIYYEMITDQVRLVRKMVLTNK